MATQTQTQPTVPNHTDTVVLVQYTVNDDDILFEKWFANIKIAYDWIVNRIQEKHTREKFWHIETFKETVNEMDSKWYNGCGWHGAIVAYNGDETSYRYCAYYNPTILYEDVRDRERTYGSYE